jgi:hypothetical protein
VSVLPAEYPLLTLMENVSELPSLLLSVTLTLYVTLVPSPSLAVPLKSALLSVMVRVRILALLMEIAAVGSLKDNEPVGRSPDCLG